MEKDLVSIIMPSYNAEKFIADSINSVINQTYQNWELLITDDCSTDETVSIIKQFAGKDERIKCYLSKQNGGAARARYNSIKIAQGRYIAFLDSDDIWLPNKLEKQIGYMIDNGEYFTCTIYGKIDENGNVLDTVIDDSKIRTYKDLLKNCPGNSTVVYDAGKIGKIYPINIRKRNDYVLWLQVIKKSGKLSCYEELLGYHRLTKGSISSNKMSLIKYHWHIYKEIEHLNSIKSIYLVSYWCLKGVIRKISK